MGVYGKRFGSKPADLKSIHIGEVRCRRELWLSQTSAGAFMPPPFGRCKQTCALCF